MMRIDDLMGCICTEAVSDGRAYHTEYSFYETRMVEGRKELPSIRNPLRLVENEDGTIEWRDD